MKKLLIFFFVSISLVTTAQEKFKLYTELSQGVSYYWKEANLYSESDINLGWQLNTSKGSFTLYAKYRFGGFVLYSSLPPYTLNYSALGGGFNYRILSQSHRISPFVRVELVTQIKKDRNEISDFYMADGVTPHHHSNLNSYPKYLSTSFIGNVYIGADFNVVKNFNINVGLGAGTREVKNVHSYLGLSTRMPIGFSAQIGFSYAFSVKKK